MSMTRRTAKTYYKSAVALLNELFIQWICVLEKVVAGWDGLDRDPANQPDRNSDPALVATSFHSYRYLRKLKTQEMLRKYKTNKASKTTSRDMCNFLRVTREAFFYLSFFMTKTCQICSFAEKFHFPMPSLYTSLLFIS